MYITCMIIIITFILTINLQRTDFNEQLRHDIEKYVHYKNEKAFYEYDFFQ